MSDADTPTEQPTPAPAPPSSTPRSSGGRVEPLVIRSWPKVVLLLPTLIAALICGFIMALASDAPPEEFGGIYFVGLAFMFVLGINLTMLLYDLNLKGFIIVALLFLLLILGLALLNRTGRVWESLGSALQMKVWANRQFYFVFSIVLLFNLFIAWVITRFNYWKVEHNEIIIHKGFMQEQERHPTAQARFTLAIEDIVEYGVLGSGKLVFYFGDDDTEHELSTVLFVHRKAKRLDELLGRVMVTHHS